MKKISLPWVIQVMEKLNAIRDIKEGKTYEDYWFAMYTAERNLKLLLERSDYSAYLRSSQIPGKALLRNLSEYTEFGNEDKVIGKNEPGSMRYACDNFKQVLLAELEVLPAFLAAQKGTHDTVLLIQGEGKIFPSTMAIKVPEATRDEIEVGKALAFELGTACGFHAFRVTETVIKKYWDYVTNSKKRPDPQTIGKFASELRDGKFGSEAIYSSLAQLSKLHRNPVIHPELFLSVEDAIGIIGMSRSVVAAMLEVIPMPPTVQKPEIPPDV